MRTTPTTIVAQLETGVKGFTLIELLTTIVVLSVILALAVPSFRWLIVSQRVQNASFEFSSALTYARNEAAKRNSNVSITALSGAANNWRGGWKVTDNGGNILQQQGAYNANDVSIADTTGNYSTLSFNRRGRIAALIGSSPPTFKITSVNAGRVTRCLTLDASGRINTVATSC